MSVERTICLAPVVYNGLGTAREKAAVVIQAALDERRVVAVGDQDELLASFPDATVERVPFALSPAPVNAHTHLDLSDMPHTPGSYEEFIAAVIAFGRTGRRSAAAAQRGIDALLAAGTHVLGDIVKSEEVMRLLLGHERLRGVAYWEVLGPDPADAPRILAETEERIEAFKAWERPGGMRVGLAPHTPHTVSAPLLRGLTLLARRRRLPMQIHVAESPAEVALHFDGSGSLADSMREHIPLPEPSGLTPVGYLESLGVLEAAPTLVHMVNVDEADVALVQRYACAVVHCPRSNVALGCGRFPWETYARHGVTVALGTDSSGSSPSLSVEEEVFAALQLHGERASARGLVRAAVKGGSRALGLTPPRFLRGDPAEKIHRWGEPSGHIHATDRVHGKT